MSRVKSFVGIVAMLSRWHWRQSNFFAAKKKNMAELSIRTLDAYRGHGWGWPSQPGVDPVWTEEKQHSGCLQQQSSFSSSRDGLIESWICYHCNCLTWVSMNKK